MCASAYSIVELLLVLAVTAVISLLAMAGYSHLLQNSYTKSTIEIMLLDANYMDRWYLNHGSFIAENVQKQLQWPSIPLQQYKVHEKIIYNIHLSPMLPNAHYYHLIAIPTIESGLKGTGCICIDENHNVLTGMSKDCNNSNQKC